MKHHSRNPQGKFFDYLKNRSLLHRNPYAIDELDVCASYLKDPFKFAEYAGRKDTMLNFSPLEQRPILIKFIILVVSDSKKYWSEGLAVAESRLVDSFFWYTMGVIHPENHVPMVIAILNHLQILLLTGSGYQFRFPRITENY